MVEKNQNLFERAKKVIPGGVNSPVRSFSSVGGIPYFVRNAEGPYVWDEEGNRYIDYVQSYGPMILGHSHPAVIEAINKQHHVELVMVLQPRKRLFLLRQSLNE